MPQFKNPILDNSFKTVLQKLFDFNGKSGIFFGNSITNGHTVYDTNTSGTVVENYVKVFSDTVGLTFTNKGVNGYQFTGGGLETCIRSVTLSELQAYNYLFISCGINDWATGYPLVDFRAAVKSCFNYVKSVFSGDVIIISPINYSSTANSGGDSHITDLHDYRQILFEEAYNYKFSFVDTRDFGFPSTTTYGDFSDATCKYLLSDGVHPTETGYQLYGKKLANVLTGVPILDDERPYNKGIFTGKFAHDGKPIWRYIFVATLESTTAQLTLTNLDSKASEVIKTDGYVMVSGQKYPLGFSDATIHLCVYYIGAIIAFAASQSFVGGDLVIEVLYTRLF